MALNPPMNNIGDPCRVEGEYFVMKRKHMEFEFKVDNGNKYTGKGYIILTTARIIAVNLALSKFKAFDLPLHLVSNNEFKQPVFGANYICGVCDPLMNSLPGKTHFKLWFMEGGCGTFVPTYFKMQEQTKKNKQIESKMMSALQNGTFNKMAYIDPNDPSIIFLEQPSIQGGNYHPGIPQMNPQPQQMSYIPNQPMPNQQGMIPPAQYQQRLMQPLMQPQYQPMMQPQYQPMMQPQFQQPQYHQPPVQQYQNPPMLQYQQPPMQQNQKPVPQYQQPPMQQYQNPPMPQYQQPPMQQQDKQPPIQQQYQHPPIQQQYQQPQQNIEPNSQENNYPEVPNAYPQPNINVLNNANIQNQSPSEQDKAKYFGFWGPELKKNN